MKKIRSLGIRGKIKEWIEKFLENRTQQVLIEGIKSKITKVKSGAVQGSVLGPLFFLIYILDMTEKISANAKIFVDDAKIKKKINSEDDVESMQSDLEKLFDWQNENKMKFNGAKFQVLRYGPNTNIKDDTMYFTENTEEFIQRESSLRDLGIILSETGKFEDHIEHVSRKVRQKVGMIFRTFLTKRTYVLKHLWQTLVQCHIDFCSQLYMPAPGHGLTSIEKLFYDFTLKIPELRDKNYWERLIYLKMNSQERRMERYRIIYIWKILNNLVPNCGVINRIQCKAGDQMQDSKLTQ